MTLTPTGPRYSLLVQTTRPLHKTLPTCSRSQTVEVKVRYRQARTVYGPVAWVDGPVHAILLDYYA